MNGELLSLGLPSGMLTIDDLFPPAFREADITEEMLERFFPEIPANSVIWRHGCIVGKPGCGKTELFKSRAKYALERYGKENVNLVYTDDLRVAIARMDTRPVQYLIVDDASKRMSSRAVFEQREVLGTFNRLRHHYEDLGATKGIVICEFGWQRWIDLDPGFRDGSSVIFKTNMTSDSERRMIEDLIGPAYMGRLDWIWDQIDRGNNKIKGLSVGRIGPKAIDQGGVGYYRHKMVWNFPEFPEILLGDEWLDDKGRYIEPKDNVSAMVRMAGRGMSQLEIAEQLGVSQSTVSRGLRKVREAAMPA
ncbi:MAG TPA: winged helix-turn-helix domain-containing protein [Methanomassiliicoccaceae archaeon]|nr:winged helix-turn-helix domain-containing protein [Methanomassiliicoccaceae archaeon]